jgi:hypothetical protein
MFLTKDKPIQYIAIAVLEGHKCPDSVALRFRHSPTCDSPLQSPSSPQCDLSSAISPSLTTSLDLDDVSSTADSSACATPLYSTPRSPSLPNSPQPIRGVLPTPFSCNATSFNVAVPANPPLSCPATEAQLCSNQTPPSALAPRAPSTSTSEGIVSFSSSSHPWFPFKSPTRHHPLKLVTSPPQCG